jgi:hypothetical protein
MAILQSRQAAHHTSTHGAHARMRVAAQRNYATHSVFQQQEKSLRKGMFPLLYRIKQVCIGLLMQ